MIVTFALWCSILIYSSYTINNKDVGNEQIKSKGIKIQKEINKFEQCGWSSIVVLKLKWDYLEW